MFETACILQDHSRILSRSLLCMMHKSGAVRSMSKTGGETYKLCLTIARVRVQWGGPEFMRIVT